MEFSQIHIRSISLPSRLHPLNSTEFEAEVEKLKSTQSPSSLSSNTIISSLLGLAELYNSMDELKQAPKSVEGALEGSVELLDFCSCIKEVVQMMKESVRALHSALRRKGGSDVQNDVASYIGSRKRINKCIKKSLKGLKSFEGRIHASDALREVYGLTAAVFRSVLLFFSYSSVADGWSRVARVMMLKKSRDHDDHGVVSEVGCVDLALGNGGFDKEMVQRRLQIVDCGVEGIEGALETMFRQLLQTRVNLLNIVTNH